MGVGGLLGVGVLILISAPMEDYSSAWGLGFLGFGGLLRGEQRGQRKGEERDVLLLQNYLSLLILKAPAGMEPQVLRLRGSQANHFAQDDTLNG